MQELSGVLHRGAGTCMRTPWTDRQKHRNENITCATPLAGENKLLACAQEVSYFNQDRQGKSFCCHILHITPNCTYDKKYDRSIKM